jgi:hypothetical protein
MNYSKNIRKLAMGKRVIALCIIVAVLFFFIGGVTGYGFHSHTKKEVQEVTELKVYGAYDAAVITKEPDFDWVTSNESIKMLDVEMDADLQEFVYHLSGSYNLEYLFIMAIIKTESDFDPSVVSNTNDYGLMQINQCNHEYLKNVLGIQDFLEPYQNIRAGTYILRKLFEKYQHPNLVLMCYNMGENSAKRLWKNGVYNTDYSEMVLKVQKEYMKQLGSETDGKMEKDKKSP